MRKKFKEADKNKVLLIRVIQTLLLLIAIMSIFLKQFSVHSFRVFYYAFALNFVLSGIEDVMVKNKTWMRIMNFTCAILFIILAFFSR